MAKIRLAESTFKLIPEGTTTFKVMSVDDSKYNDFGKLEVKMQTSKGESHTERFTLIKNNGELNEGALKAWSYFARTCLNNYQAEEIDTQDIVGCYITATVKHEAYDYTNAQGEHKSGTSVRLNDYAPSSGFAKAEEPQAEPEEVTDDFDDLEF